MATLSEFDVEDAVMQNLKNSMVRYLDSQAGIIFTSAELVAQCASTASVVFTTNGTATTTANSDLTGFNWRKIADDMQARNIPFYDGESYICIGTIKAISGLFNDTATSGFVDVKKYTGEFAGSLVRGEAGSYYQGRFVKETNFLDNSIGSGAAFGQAIAFGADAVMEGIAEPEQLRQKVPTDYGRSEGLAWYALLGWAKIWDETNDADERIVNINAL